MVELMPSLLFLTTQLHEEIESGKVQLTMEAARAGDQLEGDGVLPVRAGHDRAGGLWKHRKDRAADQESDQSGATEGHTDSVPIHTSHFRSNWSCRWRGGSRC